MNGFTALLSTVTTFEMLEMYRSLNSLLWSLTDPEGPEKSVLTCTTDRGGLIDSSFLERLPKIPNKKYTTADPTRMLMISVENWNEDATVLNVAKDDIIFHDS